MRHISLLLVVALVPISVWCVDEWGYTGQACDVALPTGGNSVCPTGVEFRAPDEWFKVSAACASDRQSPIDVSDKHAEKNAKLTPLRIRKHNTGSSSGVEQWSLTNSGNTLTLTPLNTDYTFVLKPGREKYKLKQISFHWRSSEHQINGKTFSLEAQLEFYSLDDSSKRSFIAFLFKHDAKGDSGLDKLVTFLPSARSIPLTATAAPVIVLKLRSLFPTRIRKYYRYTGSLTIPSCDEGIKWVIVADPILKASETQIVAFQSLEDGNKKNILTNSRPIQKRNGRKIYRSF